MHLRGFSVERRIPLALLFTLFLQAGAAVWWAAGKDAQDREMRTRVLQLEAAQALENTHTREMVQRLARLEAAADEHKASLRRIESILSRK